MVTLCAPTLDFTRIATYIAHWTGGLTGTHARFRQCNTPYFTTPLCAVRGESALESTGGLNYCQCMCTDLVGFGMCTSIAERINKAGLGHTKMWCVSLAVLNCNALVFSAPVVCCCACQGKVTQKSHATAIKPLFTLTGPKTPLAAFGFNPWYRDAAHGHMPSNEENLKRVDTMEIPTTSGEQGLANVLCVQARGCKLWCCAQERAWTRTSG